jgi:hypothetical protein
VQFRIRTLRGKRYIQPQGSESRKANCLLLTATIVPPQLAVSRYDPVLRLNDYLDSLKFCLSLPTDCIDRILFIDNSCNDIRPIEEFVIACEHDKLVEIISFDGNDHPLSYGKAYGEFKLIDFGLKHTSLLTPTDVFWKVTGRLQVLNLVDIIRAVRKDYDILCDLHNVPLVGTGKLTGNKWMDLRVFSCSTAAYNVSLRKKYLELGPATDQNCLYTAVMQARHQFRVVPRFPVQPVIYGISGRHERNYDGGLQRVKTRVRSYIRKFAPFLWL